MRKLLSLLGMCAAMSLWAASSPAAPVTYKFRTVLDGTLGTLAFNEAIVEILFRGDTANITTSTTGGVTVSSLTVGEASLRIFDGSQWHSANFAPGQIYLRYDQTNRLVGIGSRAGPNYPVTLSCGSGQWGSPCTSSLDYTGIAGGLADVAQNHDPQYYSQPVLQQHLTISASTYLTGSVWACVAPYSLSDDCAVAASVPLLTDAGDFYVQDHSGEANGGALVVTVGTIDGDD